MPIGILASLVDVEIMVSVFDQRQSQPLTGKKWDQALQQRSFAAAAVAGEAENVHKAFQKNSLLLLPSLLLSPTSGREGLGLAARVTFDGREC